MLSKNQELDINQLKSLTKRSNPVILNVNTDILTTAFNANNKLFMNVMKSMRGKIVYDKKNINKLVDLLIDPTFVNNIKKIVNELKNINIDELSKLPMIKNTCNMSIKNMLGTINNIVDIDNAEKTYDASIIMIKKIYDIYSPMIFTLYSTILSFINMYIKICNFDNKKIEKLQKVTKLIKKSLMFITKSPKCPKCPKVLECEEILISSQNKTYVIIGLSAVVLYLLYQKLFD